MPSEDRSLELLVRHRRKWLKEGQARMATGQPAPTHRHPPTHAHTHAHDDEAKAKLQEFLSSGSSCCLSDVCMRVCVLVFVRHAEKPNPLNEEKQIRCALGAVTQQDKSLPVNWHHRRDDKWAAGSAIRVKKDNGHIAE